MSEPEVKKEKKLSVKIFSIACTAITAILILLTCYVLISMLVARSKNRPVSLFGTSFAVVQTNSMEPEIMTGELIFFRKCDISKVREGDNIVFVAGEGFDAAIRGQNIVHKAMNITEAGIVTKGVNNAVFDNDAVTSANFLGICTGHSAFLGAVFVFLSKYGILILIAIIAVPFIISQIVKIVKLAKHPSAEGEGSLSESVDVFDESIGRPLAESGSANNESTSGRPLAEGEGAFNESTSEQPPTDIKAEESLPDSDSGKDDKTE